MTGHQMSKWHFRINSLLCKLGLHLPYHAFKDNKGKLCTATYEGWRCVICNKFLDDNTTK